MLGSESVRSEVGGIFAGKDGVGSMVAVDAFLWDDDDVDDLVEEGKLKRFTCSACRSSEHVHEVEFISHSLSIDEMIYLFKGLLPSLQPPPPPSFTLVDVGSRLGCVLFAAVFLGAAGRAIGIEMNKDLCDVQNAAVAAFQSSLAAASSSSSSSSSSSPITIIHSNVSATLATLHTADVVVLHNVFQV